MYRSDTSVPCAFVLDDGLYKSSWTRWNGYTTKLEYYFIFSVAPSTSQDKINTAKSHNEWGDKDTHHMSVVVFDAIADSDELIWNHKGIRNVTSFPTYCYTWVGSQDPGAFGKNSVGFAFSFTPWFHRGTRWWSSTRWPAGEKRFTYDSLSASIRVGIEFPITPDGKLLLDLKEAPLMAYWNYRYGATVLSEFRISAVPGLSWNIAIDVRLTGTGGQLDYPWMRLFTLRPAQKHCIINDGESRVIYVSERFKDGYPIVKTASAVDHVPFDEMSRREVAPVLLESVESNLIDLIGSKSPAFLMVRDELLVSALENQQYVTINSLAYIKDVFELWEAVEPLYRIAKQPFVPKNWADVYLTYRYGIRLFILDSLEIIEAIIGEYESLSESARNKPQSTRSMKSVDLKPFGFDDYVLYVCKIYYDTAPNRGLLELFRSFLVLLRKMDLLLLPSKLWDFLPFSFMIDWIIPVGELLQKIEARMDLVNFGVSEIDYSAKVLAVGSLDQSWLPLSHYVPWYLRFYTRWHCRPSDILDFPSIGSDAIGSGISLTHTVDTAAIAYSYKANRRHH